MVSVLEGFSIIDYQRYFEDGHFWINGVLEN